jgi:hypothetical protein
MKMKTIILFAAVAFGLLSISARAQPATVRFVSGHGQAFWITNNTDKTLSITLSKVEVQVGFEWKVYSQPTEPGPGLLYFFHHHAHIHVLKPDEPDDSNEGWLAPHEAGYGNLSAQTISLPKDAVWRARFIVEEQLTGQESIDTAAKRPAVGPALDGASYWGHPHEIYSEEVRPL